MTSVKSKAQVHKNDGTKASSSAHTTTIEKPKSKAPPSSTHAQAKAHGDVVDDKAGKARAHDAPKHGAVSGGQARQSAVHARMATADVPIANKKKELTPTDNPEWFWNGHKKWKTAPEGVDVIKNDANKNGDNGWIEKWQSPTSGNWVHNYTVDEMKRRAGEKFVHVRDFASKLPELREQLRRDLKAPGKTGEIALILLVIDQTYIRIGNEESTQRSSIEVPKGRDKKEDTFGMTTMLGGFLSKDGKTFTFKGKAEVNHVKLVHDPQVAAFLKKRKAQTKDDARLFSVSAGDVNKYLEPFGATAKSFRTHHATRLATDAFKAWAKEHPTATPAERKAAELEILKPVARALGHVKEKKDGTVEDAPETTLNNYVDTAIVTLFELGKLK